MPKALDLIQLSSSFNIGQVKGLIILGENSRAEVARFVYERLTERYIIPMENVKPDKKNGFSIMANCCLLIETYQCFKNGLNDTNARGAGVREFKDFFDSEIIFKDFKGIGDEFYWNTRCGILHQGETKKGWAISRKKGDPLFNKTELTINANLFISRLHKVLMEYRDHLSVEPWGGDVWDKCRAKISFIIANCSP